MSELRQVGVPEEYVPTVVVGGGQAGLAVGYQLTRRGLPYVILDAGTRIGDVWRNRWDTLRLFTPTRINGLEGMPFPGDPHGHASKDEVADYLEAYAAAFDLRVRLGTRVTHLGRDDDGFVLTTSTGGRLRADHVIVAMSSLQVPKVPAMAAELDPGIRSLHAQEYHNPDQLRPGGVVVVGIGNSGAEISVEVSRTHQTWLAGDEPKSLPFRIDSYFGTHVALHVIRFMFLHVLTTGTPIGRKARPKMLKGPDPLMRERPKDLRRAGVRRVPRITGVRDGRPVAGEDQVLDVANVIWCTGYRSGLDWVDLPVLDDDGHPRQQRGITEVPGLFFVGQNFLYAKASETLPGVSRDARYVVEHLARAGLRESAGDRVGTVERR